MNCPSHEVGQALANPSPQGEGSQKSCPFSPGRGLVRVKSVLHRSIQQCPQILGGHLQKRPFGLVAIVFYKMFVASLLTVTAIALLLAMKNYEGLQDFAENYELEGKVGIIQWVLDKILNFDSRTLQFSGIGAMVYAIVTAIEAVGLWHQKRWAHILVLMLVGISIPPEIYELVKGFSALKSIVFVVNVAVFWYLVRTFPKHKTHV